MCPKREHAFILRAFRHRNYALFFSGQGLSLIGTWMQQIAMTWLVYQLTNSTFFLGVVSFTSMAPIFLFSSPAGVYADNHDRYRILIGTQFFAMIQAFALSALTLLGIITVNHIVALSLFLGLVNSFDMPTRQAFVVDMVQDREDLSNAIALNSFMFNGARLIGPSIAGLLIGIVGIGACFLINGLSFLFIILSLLAMDIPRRARPETRTRLLKGLSEGYRYAFRTSPIRLVLIHLGIMSFLGMPYVVLMPYYARDYLHGGPETLGLLMAASGCGAVLGTLYLASRNTIEGLGRMIVITSVLFGLSVIAFSFSGIIPVSAVLLLFVGFGMIVQLASCNTIIQCIVQEDMRGRVMSLFAMAFAGLAPFGSLFAGALSSRLGPQLTLGLSGALCIVESIVLATRASKLEGAVKSLMKA